MYDKENLVYIKMQEERYSYTSTKNILCTYKLGTKYLENQSAKNNSLPIVYA